MATANVARDLDLLRQAVGDAQLTYLGYSYGTHIGTVYANLFPSRVRALTLDAVIEPVEWTTGRDAPRLDSQWSIAPAASTAHIKALLTFLDDCKADAAARSASRAATCARSTTRSSRA